MFEGSGIFEGSAVEAEGSGMEENGEEDEEEGFVHFFLEESTGYMQTRYGLLFHLTHHNFHPMYHWLQLSEGQEFTGLCYYLLTLM